MELRFLKGKYSFGTYKLQFRKKSGDDWKDIPVVVDPSSLVTSAGPQPEQGPRA